MGCHNREVKMEHLIEIDNLGKRYANSPQWALQDVSFQVARGQIYGLAGENGAGKTTLIRLLLGLISPTKGRAILPRGIRFSYVPDQPVFYTTFRVYAYLCQMGRITGLRGKSLRNRVTDILDVVDLESKANARIGTLSRGMLQRLSIAQAIIDDPEFIVMDEPAAALDPLGQKSIRDLIVYLNKQGKTILFSSHYLMEIERICHRLGIIHKGKLVLDARLDELISTQKWNIQVETDAPEHKIKNAISELSVNFKFEAGSVIFEDLDHEAYFRFMKLLNKHRIRITGYKSNIFLEEIFLKATGQRRD
jgi:ABC-2 type transport system ATP-binding protein